MAYRKYRGEHYMRPAWRLMLNRCYRVNSPDYSRYGGRGIEVCKRWHDFDNFLADMGERPNGMTLERVNNNGDYKPSNCRWATKIEQANNRRSNRMITHKGVTMNLKQWATSLGLKRSTLDMRIRYGWSIDKALTTNTGRNIS